MSLQFRRSMKIGPMRINFSNGGISYSAGFKGARVSVGPRGTFVTISSNGISYRQRVAESSRPYPITQGSTYFDNISSGLINELTDVDSADFINELTDKAGKISLTNWLGIFPMVIFIGILSFCSFSSREVILQAGGLRNVVTIDSYVGSNIRSLPNGKSKILGAANSADVYNLLDSSDKKWFKIKYKDSIGYVSRRLSSINVVDDPHLTETELYAHNPYYFLLLASGLVLFAILIAFLRKEDKKRFEMELNYEMDDQMSKIYKAFNLYFTTFRSSQRKWQYLNESQDADWKRNAGAGKLIKRVPIFGVLSHKVPIQYFKTNVDIPYIKLRNIELFFLPERLVIRSGNKFAAVFYKNLSIEISSTRFIESEGVPGDAKIVDHTWQYVNKNGGPDRRFSNNRQIPVCMYSQYKLKSPTGVYEIISTSRIGAFDDFANHIKQIGRLQSSMNRPTA